MKKERRIQLIYILTAAGSVLWLLTVFAAPYFRSRGSSLAGFIYGIFSPICHQLEERCLFFLGHPLAVCARCLGIYLGFLGGVLIFPVVKGLSNPVPPGVHSLVFFSIPIVLDTAANLLRVWSTSNTVRLVIGMSWGVILPFYFISGLADAFQTPRSTTEDKPAELRRRREGRI